MRMKKLKLKKKKKMKIHEIFNVQASVNDVPGFHEHHLKEHKDKELQKDEQVQEMNDEENEAHEDQQWYDERDDLEGCVVEMREMLYTV